MTLIEQIQAQKALMESKGAIGLRLELGREALEWFAAQNDCTGKPLPKQIENLPWSLKQGMEGFAILATWPETDGR